MIIYIMFVYCFVELDPQMVHIKLQSNRPSGSGEEYFKMAAILVRPNI